MGFDPQKFFIGVIDFFAVLMPGALLVYIVKLMVLPVFGVPPITHSDAERWVVFLFASYLVGHFIFGFGALIDELFYEKLIKLGYWGQIKKLSEGKALSAKKCRDFVVSKCLFGKGVDEAFMIASRLKARAMQGVAGNKAINPFQWCKAVLSKDHPAGFAAVQRFEADSKFFRSLAVVLALIIAILLSRTFIGPPVALCNILMLAACSVVGLIIAIWRYTELRFKSTEQAYWSVIALEGAKPSASASNSVKMHEGPTHAGGVVYRKVATGKKDAEGKPVFVVNYLLVQEEKNREKWVLPKGHIEPGENPCETAVREVKEETGHWASVRSWLDDKLFEKKSGSADLVRFYRMELAEDAADKRRFVDDRNHEWFSFADANKELEEYEESREVLVKADNEIIGKRKASSS